MNNSTKDAVVISLDDNVAEITELADSLGYKLVKTFIQHREKPDVNSYIGSGKLNEIREYLEDNDENVDLIIVDGELKPSQWFILEKKLNVNVYDRIRLILAIFERRADRKEARLQVKLAQLQYERPFVRELIHRARSGEHPGFMAGGEYQVDDYYETIKKQMKKIKEQLESIREERELRRRHRHIGGFYLISIAGYTNAGKSSLLNLLSDEKVKVEGRLFSTLSTTTRRIKHHSIPVLLTDTVGFIENLPAWIIDAFHSTLEEIEVADVVILVVDVSEEKTIVAKKLRVSMDELVDLGVKSSIIILFNKSDLVTDNELDEKISYLKEQGFVKEQKILLFSVINKENVDVLLDLIYTSLPQLIELKIRLPAGEKTQSFISWVYDVANVIDVSYGDFVTVTLSCNKMVCDKILSKCEELKGSIY